MQSKAAAIKAYISFGIFRQVYFQNMQVKTRDNNTRFQLLALERYFSAYGFNFAWFVPFDTFSKFRLTCFLFNRFSFLYSDPSILVENILILEPFILLWWTFGKQFLVRTGFCRRRSTWIKSGLIELNGLKYCVSYLKHWFMSIKERQKLTFF